MTAGAGPFGFSDEARRISDTVRQCIVDGLREKWVPFAMQDGTTDKPVVAYDTRIDAVRHTRNRYRAYMYLQVPWDDISPRSAEVFLKVHRQLQAIGQHPLDDEVANLPLMMDNRMEAYPSLDTRKFGHTPTNPLRRAERRSSGGIILPS
jgi:hypothetical protein